MKFDSHLVPVIIVVLLMLAAITVFFIYNPVYEGFEPYSDAGLSNFLATNPDALALIQAQRDAVAKGCAVVHNFRVVPGPGSNTPQCQAAQAALQQLARQHGDPMMQALLAKFGNVPPNFAAAAMIAVSAPVWPPPGVVAAPPPAVATQQSITEFIASNPDASELIRLQRDEVQNGCASFASGTRQPGPNIGMPQCPPKIFATNAALGQRQPVFANAFFAKFGPPTPQLIQELVRATAAAVTGPVWPPAAAPMPAVTPAAMPVPIEPHGAPMGMASAPTVGVPSSGVSVGGTSMATATPMSGAPAPFAPASTQAQATVVIPEETPPGTHILQHIA